MSALTTLFPEATGPIPDKIDEGPLPSPNDSDLAFTDESLSTLGPISNSALVEAVTFAVPFFASRRGERTAVSVLMSRRKSLTLNSPLERTLMLQADIANYAVLPSVSGAPIRDSHSVASEARRRRKYVFAAHLDRRIREIYLGHPNAKTRPGIRQLAEQTTKIQLLIRYVQQFYEKEITLP